MAKGSATIDISSLRVAGEGASKYITEINQDGIKIHAEDNVDANYTVINAEGMEVFQGDTSANSVSVAKFGAVTRIGTAEDANITIDDNSITGVGLSGKEFFTFEDSSTSIRTTMRVQVVKSQVLYYFPYTNATALRATLETTPTSKAVFSANIYSSNSNRLVELLFTVGTAETKTQNISSLYGSISVTYDGDKTFSNIKLSQHYQADTTTKITAEIRYTNVTKAPSYKIGSEHTVSGGYSYAEGYENTAHGNYSHAEGCSTTAWAPYCHAEGYSTTAGRYENNTIDGLCAHAEGNYTAASGGYSHAEGNHTVASGDYSHAEGFYTTASGDNSHAEGYEVVASGYASHAQNLRTSAVAAAQTVIGTYNVEDNVETTTHAMEIDDYGHYALIVGNGTYESPSNAMTVNWNGNLAIAGKHEALYKITTVQKVISGGINANSYVSVADITIPSASRVSGYKPVGIVGTASNYFRVQPTTHYINSDTTIYAGFANWSATNVTSDVTVTFYILWLKATSA